MSLARASAGPKKVSFFAASALAPGDGASGTPIFRALFAPVIPPRRTVIASTLRMLSIRGALPTLSCTVFASALSFRVGNALVAGWVLLAVAMARRRSSSRLPSSPHQHPPPRLYSLTRRSGTGWTFRNSYFCTFRICLMLATLMLMCAASFKRSTVSRVCATLHHHVELSMLSFRQGDGRSPPLQVWNNFKSLRGLRSRRAFRAGRFRDLASLLRG